MKKLLKTAACLGLGLFSLTTVSAKEMDLTGNSVSDYNNVYIVGNWVFQLNKYGINGKDIAEAASKYSLTTGKSAPVYYILGGQVYEYENKGAASAPKALGAVENVFDDEKINALGLNGEEYEDLVLEEVEPVIKNYIEQLNETADKYGFYSIDYEDYTATFYISDPGKSLAGYKDQILDLIKTFIDDDYGLQSVTFNGKEYSKEELTEEGIVSLAVEVLTKMAGEEARS